MQKHHKWLLHHSCFLTGCFSSIRTCFDLTNTGECNSLLHYVAIWRNGIRFAGKINGILCMWLPCGGGIMMMFDETVLHLLLNWFLISVLCLGHCMNHYQYVGKVVEYKKIVLLLPLWFWKPFFFFLLCQPFFSIEEGTRLILVLQVVLLEGLVVKTMAPEREVATSC